MNKTEKLDVHTFNAHGEYFLYDVQSNFRKKITPVLYEVLQFREYPLTLEHFSKLAVSIELSQLKAAIKTLDHLIKKKKIHYFKVIENTQKRIPLNSLDLCVVQDCNMKCTYCYAHYGTYSEIHKTSKMDIVTARKAVDFLLEHSKNYPYIKITFFGGEPLLNFEVIKEVVRYADIEAGLKKKRVIYDMVTNGILLKEEVCEFLLKHNISVIVSLDGYKEINDKTKLFGKSHYDVVMKNIKPYIKKLHITTRTTTCKTNYKHIIPIADHFNKLGIKNISFEEIGEGGDNCLGFSDVEKQNLVFPEYEKTFDYAASNLKKGKKMLFFPYITYLSRLFMKRRNFYGCAAGRSHLSIGSEGDIYPCHRLMDIKDFQLGNIHDGSFNEDILEMYHHNSIHEIASCRNCFARFICAGDCLRGHYVAHKVINKPDNNRCLAIKKHVELAIVASFQIKKWHVLPYVFRLMRFVYGSPGYILKDNDKELIRYMCKVPMIK